MAGTRSVLTATILFAVVSSPQTYAMVDRLLGSLIRIVSPSSSGPNTSSLFNASSTMGMLLQSLLFAVLVSQFA